MDADQYITATGKDTQGKEFDLDFVTKVEEWLPVSFPEYTPTCHIKLDSLRMDNRTTISGGRASM